MLISMTYMHAHSQGKLKASMMKELQGAPGSDPRARLKCFKERERAVAELEMKMKMLKKSNPKTERDW